MKPIVISASAKQNLVAKVKAKDQVFGFAEEPVLAALCTCVALDFEIGNPEFDRFSAFLGVEDLSQWEKQIFVQVQDIGIELRRKDGQLLKPMHPDLRFILDASSLNEKGELSRAVIFPRKVAAHFKERGFNLVIVRDWILGSALSLDDKVVGYLVTNEWEIRNHIAHTQSQLMLRHQLPFFGTHDIVDHLFGLDAEGYDQLRDLHQRTQNALTQYFSNPGTHKDSRPHLLISYLVGVALDDLAQPRWYGSRTHAFIVERCLDELSKLGAAAGSLELPQSFHQVASVMREKLAAPKDLAHAMQAFTADIAV